MRTLSILAMILLAQTAISQPAPQGTLRSNSTLVVVPTLVQTASGELVSGLQPADFVLTDNGVPQAVAIEQAENTARAVVVLLQIGGEAPRQFVNYAGVPAMLDTLTGSAPSKVALVTFDSQPEEASNFTPDVADLSDVLAHPRPGDGGAAILDAVSYAIDLLRQQPAGTERIILLLSQTHDEGRKARADAIVRRLGESNTLICSLTFSPEKTWLKDQFTKGGQENPPYEFSPGIVLLHTFDLGTPLLEALKSVRGDTSAAIATLSGGESLPFGGKADLERNLAVLANHIPNRYTLTFQPATNEPGLHAIQVTVLHQSTPVSVKARSTYWSGPQQP